MMRRARSRLVVCGLFGLCALALALIGSGCGSGSKQSAASSAGASTKPSAPPEQQPTATTEQHATGETVPAPTDTTSPGTSPDQSAGGAGGAEPARTLAQFTGRGGRVTPRLIRVPSGIPIRVELRSADGGRYAVDFGDGHRLTTGRSVASASTMLTSLIPHAEYLGRPIDGDFGSITVIASSRPGP